MEKKSKLANLPAGRQGNLPRDVFLHLLAVVALYWSSISFTAILWQIINYFFQNAADYFSYNSFSDIIRFSVSSLIIVFPVYISVSWYLNKIYKKEINVRESKIRKWLIYFTLFVASLVIIGDLVTVINALLGGEIAIRFILKSLSVFLVALVVFGYYLDDVRRTVPTPLAKYFAWSSGVLVVSAIITSFFIIGSPTTARLMQLDQQRINDLQSIQYQIVNYWQTKQKLPEKLSDLNDDISGFFKPTDPVMNSDYEYIIIDSEKLSFQLCANFDRENKMDKAQSMFYYGMGMQNWNHSSGRVCFDRKIDKDLYPPLNKTQ
jgi:hypothetical protein